MLEQSTLHGRIFKSEVSAKILKSKPIAVDDIQFGPMRPVEIHRISDHEMWVQDRNRGNWYHYQDNGSDRELQLLEVKDHMSLTSKGFFYYYGKALCKYNKIETEQETVEHDYFVQNVPSVTAYDKIPDINQMQMPLTMQALDYDQIFHYPTKLKKLLENIPACYVDRYKRPIKRKCERTYPIAMDQVKTTWTDLEETSYPVVVDFEKTIYGVVDLEPTHTEDDLAHFQGLSGYYEEETPRGGRHKIVRITDKTYKYRYSPGLEIINQSQVTLYGINAKWLADDPPILDITSYQTVGHEKQRQIVAHLERPDVSKEVEALQKKAIENMSMGYEIAAKLYRMDTDDSHGEYMVLQTLFKHDIKPYARQFPKEQLPWILESYASSIINHRDKHETLRQGLPYLVYLSAIICRKEDSRIWI